VCYDSSSVFVKQKNTEVPTEVPRNAYQCVSNKKTPRFPPRFQGMPINVCVKQKNTEVPTEVPTEVESVACTVMSHLRLLVQDFVEILSYRYQH
jgi:hypothetical protein